MEGVSFSIVTKFIFLFVSRGMYLLGNEQKEREQLVILEQEQYDQNKVIAAHRRRAAARDATVLAAARDATVLADARGATVLAAAKDATVSAAARDATVLAANDRSVTDDAMDAEDDHRSGTGSDNEKSDEDFDPTVDK